MKLPEDLIEELELRIERLEGRNKDWIKRIMEASECLIEVEERYRGCEAVESEDWVALSHAAKLMEELEKDVRSDMT